MSVYVVTFPVLYKLIQYKDLYWESKLQPLCLAKGLSHSSFQHPYALSPSTLEGHKSPQKHLLWHIFILNVEPGNCSHHQVVLEYDYDIQLARQRACDFVSHDTSLYGINLNKCRAIHYISTHFIHLINLCICIHIQVHTYIHTYIHAYIIFV